MAKGDGQKGKTAAEAFDDGDDEAPRTVRDTKRGKAADDYQVPVDGKSEEGDNSFVPAGETLDEILELVRQEDDEIEKLNDKIKTKTQPERDKIKACRERIGEAKERLVGDGYKAALLDVLIGEMRDRRKADKRKEQLDPAHQKQLKAYHEAWKAFRGTPLGQAAEQREAGAVH